MNSLIQADSRVCASPVMMLLVGDPRLFLASVPKDSPIHCSAVWSCREKISLQSLTHIVELNDGKDGVPVLWRFLQKVSAAASQLDDAGLSLTSLTPAFRKRSCGW